MNGDNQTAIERWWLEFTLGGGDKKAALNRWLFALAWGVVGFLVVHSFTVLAEYGVGGGARWYSYVLFPLTLFFGAAATVRAHWLTGKSQWLKRWPLKGE